MREIGSAEREETAAIPWGTIERPHLVRPAVQENLVAGFTGELAAAWCACGAFEWVALGYLSVSAVLIAAFHANLAHPLLLFSAQACVAAVILALCASFSKSEARAEMSGETWASWNLHFWRHWYPHLFFLFCFEEMGRLVHLVYPGWHDAKLIAFDRWLTGVNPQL